MNRVLLSLPAVLPRENSGLACSPLAADRIPPSPPLNDGVSLVTADIPSQVTLYALAVHSVVKQGLVALVSQHHDSGIFLVHVVVSQVLFPRYQTLQGIRVAAVPHQDNPVLLPAERHHNKYVLVTGCLIAAIPNPFNRGRLIANSRHPLDRNTIFRTF